MAADAKEETIIETFLKAVENTKSTTEMKFDNLELGIPQMKIKFVLNGKISLDVRPLHD